MSIKNLWKINYLILNFQIYFRNQLYQKIFSFYIKINLILIKDSSCAKKVVYKKIFHLLVNIKKYKENAENYTKILNNKNRIKLWINK